MVGRECSLKMNDQQLQSCEKIHELRTALCRHIMEWPLSMNAQSLYPKTKRQHRPKMHTRNFDNMFPRKTRFPQKLMIFMTLARKFKHSRQVRVGGRECYLDRLHLCLERLKPQTNLIETICLLNSESLHSVVNHSPPSQIIRAFKSSFSKFPDQSGLLLKQ